MSEREERVQRYAWEMILDGAESTIEDDTNEDGKLSDAEHEQAYELAMKVVRGLKDRHLSGEADTDLPDLGRWVDEAEGIIDALIRTIDDPSGEVSGNLMDSARAWRQRYLATIEARNSCPNCGKLDGCECQPLPAPAEDSAAVGIEVTEDSDRG